MSRRQTPKDIPGTSAVHWNDREDTSFGSSAALIASTNLQWVMILRLSASYRVTSSIATGYIQFALKKVIDGTSVDAWLWERAFWTTETTEADASLDPTVTPFQQPMAGEHRTVAGGSIEALSCDVITEPMLVAPTQWFNMFASSGIAACKFDAEYVSAASMEELTEALRILRP